MEDQMKAIVLVKPCKANELKVSKVQIPKVKPGYSLIKIKAFGVNESEVTSRKGESDLDFQFPRILGIEGTGVIAETCKDSKFKVGQKVITMMGGMGRSIDGSYAEYSLVKEEDIIPFESDLDWSVIGALPEMLQTAYGSLSQGLQIQKGDTLLVRGGSSTVGLTSAILAHHMGAKVIATTRNKSKLTKMKELGIDYPVLDNKQFAQPVKNIAPTGVNKILELVGFTTLFEDMNLAKQGAYACFTGALGGQWTFDNFSPFMIPNGIFLTSYAGEATDLPAKYFGHVLRLIEVKQLVLPIAKVYHSLDKVGEAQSNLESGKFSGKHVVVLD